MNRKYFFIALLLVNAVLLIALIWLYHELTLPTLGGEPALSLDLPSTTVPPATASPSPSVTRPSATPSLLHTPTPVLTAVVNPVPTATASVTLDADPQIQILLDRKPDAYCLPNSPTSSTCHDTALVSILEYLDSHPTSPAHSKLQDKLFDLARHDAFDSNHVRNWIADDWLNTILPERIRTAIDPETNAPYLWQNRMRVVKADMDQDGQPDYFVALGYDISAGRATGNLYWIRFDGTQPTVETLPTDFEGDDARFPQILAARDLNGDNRPDLAYTVNDCGASNCLVQLRVITRVNKEWQHVPRIWGMTALNGGWQIKDMPDGTSEFIMDVRDGDSQGTSGPSAPYELHFRWLNDEYVPVLTSLDSKLAGLFALEYSEQLVQEGRYDDAITDLQQVSLQPLEDSSQTFDYRPYALFRIGMLYLYLADTENAQRVWQELTTQYADLQISQDVSKFRSFVHAPTDVWQVCQWLDKNASNWNPKQDLSIYGRQYPAYFGWYRMCHPTKILKAMLWSRTTSLESQMQTRGMTWQTVSDAFDLNGDGVNDPIGLFSFQKVSAPWAMLTQNDHYDPIVVSNPSPIGAIPEPGGYSSDCKFLRVTDLNLDGAPEVMFLCRYGVDVWQWLGNGFALFEAYCPYLCDSVVIQTDAKPGLGSVLIYTPETQLIREKATRLYELRGTKWVWVIPTEEGPQVPPPNPPPTLLSEAIRLIFREQAPQAALTLLKTPDITNPENRNAYEYLQAVAYNKLGETARANSVWSQLAEHASDSGWGIRAKERLERGW